MVSLDEIAAKSRKKAEKDDESDALANARADISPSSGFWLEVDGRAKKGWPELDTAERVAKALKQKYAHLRVEIYDAVEKKRIQVD